MRAMDGKQAIAEVRKWGPRAFALIILDYNMPTNGLLALREIKKISEQNEVSMPCVVFLSAYLE